MYIFIVQLENDTITQFITITAEGPALNCDGNMVGVEAHIIMYTKILCFVLIRNIYLKLYPIIFEKAMVILLHWLQALLSVLIT